MKIYLIKNEGHTRKSWDENAGHVIAANTEEEVRDIAKIAARGEGPEVWDAATVTMVGEYTGTKVEPFIILTDFHAG